MIVSCTATLTSTVPCALVPPRAGLAASLASSALRAGAQTPPEADAEFLRHAYDTLHVDAAGVAVPSRRPGRTSGPTNISGRATDIAVADTRRPARASTPRYATSGVWKTDDNGATWQAIFEHMPSTSIGDIAVAPSNPDIVWVGTGEANIFRASMAGRGHLQVDRRGRDVAAHGPHRHARPSRASSCIRPTRTSCTSPRPGHEWTDNDDARRVQDDGRRPDLDEGLLQEPAHRRDRPRDGSARSEHAVRRDVAAHPAQVERPARRARLQRRRRHQDDRRRADLDGRRARACRRRSSAAASASTSRARIRTRSTRSWTTTRSAACRRRASATRTAGRCRRARASSRAPTSIDRTTPARRGGRRAATTRRRSTTSTTTRARTAGCSVRFASIRRTENVDLHAGPRR